jgi:6-phosphogluconate dehydrogenase
MQLAMIGLGRMGGNMARRLIRAGHEVIGFNRSPEPVQALIKDGGKGASSIDELVAQLKPPRALWVMVPAGDATEQMVMQLAAKLSPGDTVIDGGNSYFKDDVRRGKALAEKKLHYVDVGTSGGIWGIDRGYCLMIGGPKEAVSRLEPIFERRSLPAAATWAARTAATTRPRARRRTVGSTVAPQARATSSRWSTTGSSTA